MIISVTYELLLRIVSQITNSNYMDLVFTGTRRYEFGRSEFLTSIVHLDNNQDIDIVFPVAEPYNQLQSIITAGGSGETVTSPFESHSESDYIGSSISGYIEIMGFNVNLIGRPVGDVEDWKFATRIMSHQLWEHTSKLKYDRDYRIEVFKALRKAND